MFPKTKCAHYTQTKAFHDNALPREASVAVHLHTHDAIAGHTAVQAVGRKQCLQQGKLLGPRFSQSNGIDSL